jgi:Tfp pilus assembly protein PilV
MIELLVAMVVMAICLMGLMSLQLANIRSMGGSRGREMAVSLAKSVMDEIQACAQISQLNSRYGIAVPATATTAATYFDPGVTTGNVYYDFKGVRQAAAAGAAYSLTWTRSAPKENTPNTSEFQVTTAWSFDSAVGAAPRRVSMNRLVYR